MPAAVECSPEDSSNSKKTPQQLWQEVDSFLQETNGKLFSETKGILWDRRHAIEQLLERIILGDLDYAMKKEADVLLWNTCYKSCIDYLRKKRKSDMKNGSGELQMLLIATAGSLNRLLASVAITYNLQLPGFRHSSSILSTQKKSREIPSCSPGSAVSVVEFCLIHMGDISRYQSEIQLAESFYAYAAKLSPTKGHAFNQLGIIEASRGNKLTAAYFYSRSLHVAQPFQPAAGNLESLFSLKESSSVSSLKCHEAFIRINSYLQHFHRFDEIQTIHFPAFVSTLKSAFNDGSLSSNDCFQMVIISISSLWRISRDFPIQEDKDFKLDDLSHDEQRSHAASRTLLRALVEQTVHHVLSLCAEANRSDLDKENLSGWLKVLGFALQFIESLSKAGEIVILHPDSSSSPGLIQSSCHLLASLKNLWNQIGDSVDLIEIEKVARHARPTIDELKTRLLPHQARHIEFWNALPTIIPSELAWMPLPENNELRGFHPLEETNNSLVVFQSGWEIPNGQKPWRSDVETFYLFERRILRTISVLALVVSNRCAWSNKVLLYDLDQLGDWEFVKTHVTGDEKCPVALPKPQPAEIKSSGSSTSASPSVSNRRTKVSDRLTGLMKMPADSKDGTIASGTDVKSPPGLLKLKMPTETETEKEPKRETERKRSDSEYRPRFQPPRFQAAKLKQALTGKTDAEQSEREPTIHFSSIGFAPPFPGDRRIDISEGPDNHRGPSPVGVTTPDTADMAGPWDFPRTPGSRPPFPPFGGRLPFFNPLFGPPQSRMPYPFQENQHRRPNEPPPGYHIPPPGFQSGINGPLPPPRWARPPMPAESSFSTPPPDNSVFFSNPKDPFYQVWQNDSPLGSGPASEDTSQEVWGSGTIQNQRPASSTNYSEFQHFHPGVNTSGFPFNSLSHLSGRQPNDAVSSTENYPHLEMEGNLYQQWSAEDGK